MKEFLLRQMCARFFLPWLFLFGLFLSPLALHANPPRKTLLILSSKGGGGHAAAAATIQELVDQDYDIKIIYPIDQLRIWSISSGEQFYNKMLQSGWTRSMNFIVRNIAPHLFNTRQDKLEKIIGSAIGLYHPSLVISLIPFVNYPASEAARKSDIPYLLVTTDNDLRNWVLGLEKLKHPHFKVTIGVDLPTTRDLLLKKCVPEAAIQTIGLPLRPEFIAQKDVDKIKEELQIDKDKPVVLIMMGGAGGSNAYYYAEKIGALDISTHMIVVAGRNQKLFKELNKLKLSPSNSMTLFGFTNRVADLMAISDVIITKPGPGTINEAIAMELPMLIDATEKSLFWERANVEMVLDYGIGYKIAHPRQLQPILETLFSEDALQTDLRDAFITAPHNEFHLRIKQIIDEMAKLEGTLALDEKAQL